MDIKFSKPTTETEQVKIPDVDILTSEEVAKERLRLVPFSEKPNLVQEETSTTTSDFIYTNENTAHNSESLGDEPPKTYLIKDSTGQSTETSTSSTYEYKRQGSTISITTTETDQDIESKKTPFTLEGSVYSVDSAKQEFTIVLKNGTGFGKIHVSKETKFIINGSGFNFSDLKISDKVNIEGTGSISSNEMTAKIVTITGSVSIIPIN